MQTAAELSTGMGSHAGAWEPEMAYRGLVYNDERRSMGTSKLCALCDYSSGQKMNAFTARRETP
jgi:hypothetical protein